MMKNKPKYLHTRQLLSRHSWIGIVLIIFSMILSILAVFLKFLNWETVVLITIFLTVGCTMAGFAGVQFLKKGLYKFIKHDNIKK